MKLLVVISIIACSYAAQLDRSYLPPPGATTAGGSPGSITGPRGGTGDQGFGPTSSPGLNQLGGTAGSFGQPAAQYGPPSGASGSPLGSFGFSSIQSARGQYQPERARASIDRNAETLRYDNRIDGDTFAYSFETSNGISAEESGIATNGVQAQGAFAYTGDDGQIYRVTYTADKNGYQPQGDHLPTPPPIPEEILRSIEKNARAAAAGTQEGAYNPNEDTLQSNQQYTGSSNFGSNQDVSRSDTGTINSFPNQNQGVVVGQSGYQAPGSSDGVQSAAAGYQQQAPTQRYNAPNAGGSSGTFTATQGPFGVAQPTIGSSRPGNQYISPATGQGYNPSSFGSTQTVQIGSQLQYSSPSTRPTATGPVPSPTASGPSPSGFAPATSAGPTNPTSYTSSNPSISPFAVSNATPTGFAPSGSTVSGPSPSSSAPSGPSARPSDFAPSNPTASSTRPNNPPSTGVQISEYSKAGQVTPQNDDGYNYNRPQPGFGDSRTQVPAGSQRPTSSSEQGFIINVQGSTGTNSPDQYQTNKPFGSRTSMSGAAGYKYKRPGTQSRAPGASGAGKSDNGSSGLAFGGPRQPPSFSQDEGYKY